MSKSTPTKTSQLPTTTYHRDAHNRLTMQHQTKLHTPHHRHSRFYTHGYVISISLYIESAVLSFVFNNKSHFSTNLIHQTDIGSLKKYPLNQFIVQACWNIIYQCLIIHLESNLTLLTEFSRNKRYIKINILNTCLSIFFVSRVISFFLW